jgi:hypothetical protein
MTNGTYFRLTGDANQSGKRGSRTQPARAICHSQGKNSLFREFQVFDMGNGFVI